MEDTWTLLVLSLAMLVGCYVAGMLPFAFQFAENKIKMVPVFGTGLLIGTSLAVIIPEGVHVMYINHHGHNHDELDKLVSKETVANQARNAVLESHGHESHNDQPANIHSIIGVALVAGFICMLLIDQCFGGGSHHFHSAADTEVAVNQPNSQNRHKITATLGLVVHAAADGIALGAAITMSEDRITMIVFLAIMLHKAPAAFGLVSFLMLEGFERSRIRKHLFVFSLSAPLLSIITFFGLSQQSKETLSNMHATGIALLFSAGTFLYVATVHVLPEVANTSGHTTHDGNTIVREHKGFTKKELLAIVVGAAIPVFLAMGHKH